MMTQRAFDDPKWWDARVADFGFNPEASDYSNWSHERRLSEIRSVMQSIAAERQIADSHLPMPRPSLTDMSVLDVPCGVGLLDAEAGPFKRYVGVDFSDRAIKEAGRRVRSRKVELVCGDAIASVRLMKDQMGSFDVVICCGLLCFPAMFQDVASAAEYVQRLSELVVDDGAVIANMPWSGHKYEDDIAVYSIDEAIRCLDDKGLHVEVRFGYLPHEFIVVCRKKENER